MDKPKRNKLEKAGWRVGTVAEFLDLTEEEAAFVELKLALSEMLRERRVELGLSQVELARRLGSSQSRVAKMEASDASVSVDLLLRGLFATHATRADIAAAVGRGIRRPRRRASQRRKAG